RVERIRADLELCDQAVLSGSLVGWGDELIPLFSLAVRLVTETSVRLERLKKREKERFGSRIEAGGDRHRAHLEFIAWAARYDDGGLDMRSRARHDEWQKQLPCKQLVLNGELPLAENLKRMKGFLL
ncbi:MAG: shikimate kinase, partial [Clostridiales bacterium]|nr:shikimate kinase [Clostridiales bacterium]